MTKVTPEIVYDILTSSDSHRITAERHSVSRQTVEQIRFGLGHKKLFPEIPRRNSFVEHSCECCALWLKNKCSIDLPEPTHNLYFATECNVFTKIQND